jgi:phosphosulfolactate synthase (CoM biosynthesis protein A)
MRRTIAWIAVLRPTYLLTLPTDDWLRLVDRVQKAGLKAKPEVGIQFGAGGASAAEALEAEGTRDVDWALQQAKKIAPIRARR